MNAALATPVPASKKNLDYRTVWRWHFYAGLFCIPFVLWLSVTGTIFLFHPQIQQWLDRPYTHLAMDGHRANVRAQVEAALAAVPGSHLHAYELPHTPTSPAEVLVDKGTLESRVYVHPQTARVLKIDDEDMRVDQFIKRLHGELLIGEKGSMIVELAASWAVVMIVTGLFLWWPRGSERLAGVLYPRLRSGQRIFWRDLHAVTGIWISFFALFLLFTGLPWAKSWSGYLKAARHLAGERSVKQDWTTSSAAEKTARSDNSMAGMDMGGMDMGNMSGMDMGSISSISAIDRVVATVAPMHLAEPVLVFPPRTPGGNWTAKSDSGNRRLRVDLTIDGASGAVVKRTDFSQKAWVDRVVGTGISAHEGRLFGPLNQLLGLMTTCGLMLLSVSALVMWWRRKPEGVLGAPTALRPVRFSSGLIAFMIALGLYMPFLGGSMILVGLIEHFVLRKIPAARRWLGLYGPQGLAA